MRTRVARACAALALAVSTIAVGAAVAPPPAEAAAYPCSVNQTLRYGQVNSCVRSLQIYLNGYINAKLAVDSSFGPATRAAVRNFQSRAKIQVDGIVGPQTRNAICARTGIPVNSGATRSQIVAAGEAVFQMCWGWGFSFN